MQELISAIRAWPIIIQGALGSALFWIVLLVGQRLASSVSSKYSHFSRTARIAYLISEQTKCLAASSEGHLNLSTYTNLLMYRGSRHFVKAIMWLVMGLMTGTIFGEFSVIGYVGCLYYLFKTYQVIAPVPDEYRTPEMLQKIVDELAGLRS